MQSAMELRCSRVWARSSSHTRPAVQFRIWLQTSNLPAPPAVDRGLIPDGMARKNKQQVATSRALDCRPLAAQNSRYTSIASHPPLPSQMRRQPQQRHSRAATPALPPLHTPSALAEDQLLRLRTAARNASLSQSWPRTTGERSRRRVRRRLRASAAGDVTPPPSPPPLDGAVRVTRYNIRAH